MAKKCLERRRFLSFLLPASVGLTADGKSLAVAVRKDSLGDVRHFRPGDDEREDHGNDSGGGGNDVFVFALVAGHLARIDFLGSLLGTVAHP